MRFIMALALLWITQLQATPSLLEEAELQAARDPVGYLQRLDASPQAMDSRCFWPPDSEDGCLSPSSARPNRPST